MEEEKVWELVESKGVAYTMRLSVPGGWLYRHKYGGDIHMSFVKECAYSGAELEVMNKASRKWKNEQERLSKIYHDKDNSPNST